MGMIAWAVTSYRTKGSHTSRQLSSALVVAKVRQVTAKQGETSAIDIRCYSVTFLVWGLVEISDLLRTHFKSWTGTKSCEGRQEWLSGDWALSKVTWLWICNISPSTIKENPNQLFSPAEYSMQELLLNPGFQGQKNSEIPSPKGLNHPPHAWELPRRNVKKWHVWLSASWASPRQLSYPVDIGMEAGGWTPSK